MATAAIFDEYLAGSHLIHFVVSGTSQKLHHVVSGSYGYPPVLYTSFFSPPFSLINCKYYTAKTPFTQAEVPVVTGSHKHKKGRDNCLDLFNLSSYSTVTLLAKFRGLSTSKPLFKLV